jgi:lipid II:glycine glycyltransferase (peptidoglycan interpeptide bridge formation enzyme)
MQWKTINEWVEVPRLFSKKKESVYLPFLNYTSNMSSSPDINTQASNYFQIRTINENLSLNFLHSGNLSKLNFKDTVTMRLELNNKLWSETFSSNLRRKIRKAQKSNFEISFGRSNSFIDRFYKIYYKRMKEYGMPSFPKKLLDSLSKSELKMSIFIISSNNTDLGGLVIFQDEDLAWVCWAASDRDNINNYCNYLLYWCAIDESFKDGMKYFDFGRCGFGTSSYEFKRQFGTYHVYLEIISNRRVNIYRKYQLSQFIWRNLPNFITKQLEGLILKYLPDL